MSSAERPCSPPRQASAIDTTSGATSCIDYSPLVLRYNQAIHSLHTIANRVYLPSGEGRIFLPLFLIYILLLAIVIPIFVFGDLYYPVTRMVHERFVLLSE